MRYSVNQASVTELYEQLTSCTYIPPLESRVSLKQYSEKIHCNAVRFEYWDHDNILSGLCAMYTNYNNEPFGYITNVGIRDLLQGKGIATQLLAKALKYAKDKGLYFVDLEVFHTNTRAIALYKKFGFYDYKQNDDRIFMRLDILKYKPETGLSMKHNNNE